MTSSTNNYERAVTIVAHCSLKSGTYILSLYVLQWGFVVTWLVSRGSQTRDMPLAINIATYILFILQAVHTLIQSLPTFVVKLHYLLYISDYCRESNQGSVFRKEHSFSHPYALQAPYLLRCRRYYTSALLFRCYDNLTLPAMILPYGDPMIL